MDYQCVVVYTVINIAPPKVNEQKYKCLSWFSDKIKRAVAVHLKSLKHSQDNGLLYGNLACSYYRQGLLDMAIETYKRAIELHPNFPDAYCNLANALKEKGFSKEAEECYNSALRLCPSHVDTLNNLGNVKREHGKFQEATNLYLRALEVFPNFAATHSNVASLLQQQGKLQEALIHYKQAINIQPWFADAYSNMGNTLRELKDIMGALHCFRKAIKINPSFADAHCNLASIYKDTGNIKEAMSSYINALNLKPDFPDAYCNLCHCLQIVCDWEFYEERMKTVVYLLEDQLVNEKLPSVHPHHSMLYPFSNETRKHIAKCHANLYVERINMFQHKAFEYMKSRKNRIRIGYVSSDFGNHPTSHLMQSIPGFHDQTNFEIFCYALNPDDGTEFRKKINEQSEHFVDISNINDNLVAASKINCDSIDILVNMNGYTKGSRNELFALRPAPIQVMWLGYPGTSGSTFIDYIITDEIASPLQYQNHYSEKFAYMPETYFIGDHKQMFPHLKERYLLNKDKEETMNDEIINIPSSNNISDVVKCHTLIKIDTNQINIPAELIDCMLDQSLEKTTHKDINIYNGAKISKSFPKVASGEEIMTHVIYTDRRQYGLPKGSIVYCNFNQLYKLDPNVIKIWVNILVKVPNSVLWILRFPKEGVLNIINYAKRLGLLESRIVFSNISCKEEHVRRGQLADVCLDTLLCNGHTTTMDILWTGTPVVTLPGDTLASRVAASQLTALGCEELIASTPNQYQEIAIRLGTDKNYRHYIRRRITKARLEGHLFDCQQYARGLENLYQQMFDKYQREENPDHIKASV